MNAIRKLLNLLSNYWRLLGVCLVSVVLLVQVAVVLASHTYSDLEAIHDSTLPLIDLGPSQAPIAVDDSGQGFTTDEDHILNTASVLTNDSDADGDDLFVYSFDTANTLGLVSSKDGELDPGFDQDGKVTTQIGWLDYARDLTIQPDGKIIMAGYFIDFSARHDFAVLRYHPDGSLDQSFDGDGIVVTDFGWTDNAYSVAYQPDNKILVAGHVYENNIGIARYNPDGSPDLTFDYDGKVITTGINVQEPGFMGMSLQTDGKIVVVATSFDLNIGYTVLIARFNPNGSLDLTFDEDGIVTTGIRNYTLGYDIVIQPDHKILVSGYGSDYVSGEQGIVLIRYNPDGSLDDSFSGDGLLLTDVGPTSTSSLGKAMALQADGKIVVTGNTEENFALVRYNPDGSLDTTFDGDGIVLTSSINSSDIVLQPTGKIIVAGTTGSTGSGYDMGVVRYESDGSLDTMFGNAGIVVIDFGDDRGSATTLGPNGTILIAGSDGGSFALARIYGDGTFSYDPNHQFEYLRVGEQANDTFTYTVSDGILTDTATVTITLVGVNESIYMPILLSPVPAIYGQVTENGVPAAGIELYLRFYDGADWFTIASTITGSNGYYFFYNVPALTTGQRYYVLYSNPGYQNRLWVWGTRDLTSYAGNSIVNIGDFDISNIELISPVDEATLTLPYTFQWNARLASLNDSYEFDLYDPIDGNPYFFTEPALGYVNSYTLTGRPSGFVNGYDYVWEIWVYSPDGGFGISFETRYVRFTRAGLISTAVQPIQPKTVPDLEDLRKR